MQNDLADIKQSLRLVQQSDLPYIKDKLNVLSQEVAHISWRLEQVEHRDSNSNAFWPKLLGVVLLASGTSSAGVLAILQFLTGD